MKVKKRNGELQDFDFNKIRCAVMKAFKECGVQLSKYEEKDLFESIEDKIPDLEKDGVVDLEDIQNLNESQLMFWGYYDVAKAYIIYRYNRQVERDNKFEEKLLGKKIDNQNANVDEYSFGGRTGEASRIMTQNYALNHCMSKLAKERHLNNQIYIHDLDSYAIGMHNCLTLPFDKLLANGFNTRQTDVRPANSVNTAFQLVAVLFQLQSLQQFGGVSASHLDWTMVPYVRKSFAKHFVDGVKFLKHQELNKNEYSSLKIDNKKYREFGDECFSYAKELTEKELKQAVEGLYHNLNTLQSRSGNQLPFTSINYGTCTLPEGRMVISALLNGSINGVGKFHRTAIFPCGIFQIMKGVNKEPGTPNYDLKLLALKSTSLRLYPNYANVDWSGNAGYDRNDPRTYFSTMGCRTANGFDINGFGQLKDGRGNICPCTIILPTIAMEVNGNIERFMEVLDERIHETKDILIERFNWICSQNPKSAKFMWENGTMEGYIPEEGIRSALKHGTLAVGLLGLAETLQLLIGEDQTTQKGLELAKRILQLFKTRCAEFKEQQKLNFGVYLTPAENLCFTAMKKFQKKYGIIKDVSDHEYFTNSIHVPVWKEMTPFEKIDIESQLTGYSSAGCITYVELDSSVKHNIEGLEEIVDYAMDHDIPYFAVNIPNDTCNDCGYTGDFTGDKCPICGSENITRLARVTGYLSQDYRNFNYGKQCEKEARVKHIRKIQ